jgi:hypothetical protein
MRAKSNRHCVRYHKKSDCRASSRLVPDYHGAEARIYCWGHIEYEDVFRARWRSRFSVSVGGEAFSRAVNLPADHPSAPQWDWQYASGPGPGAACSEAKRCHKRVYARLRRAMADPGPRLPSRKETGVPGLRRTTKSAFHARLRRPMALARSCCAAPGTQEPRLCPHSVNTPNHNNLFFSFRPATPAMPCSIEGVC